MNIKILIPVLMLPLAVSLGGCNDRAKLQRALAVEKERQAWELKYGQPHELRLLQEKNAHEIEVQERRDKYLAGKQKEDHKHALETQKAQNAHNEAVYETMEPALKGFILVSGLVFVFFIASRTADHIADKSAETSMHNTRLHEETLRIRDAAFLEDRRKAREYAIDKFLERKDEFTKEERKQFLTAYLGSDSDTPPALPENT